MVILAQKTVLPTQDIFVVHSDILSLACSDVVGPSTVYCPLDVNVFQKGERQPKNSWLKLILSASSYPVPIKFYLNSSIEGVETEAKIRKKWNDYFRFRNSERNTMGHENINIRSDCRFQWA